MGDSADPIRAFNALVERLFNDGHLSSDDLQTVHPVSSLASSFVSIAHFAPTLGCVALRALVVLSVRDAVGRTEALGVRKLGELCNVSRKHLMPALRDLERQNLITGDGKSTVKPTAYALKLTVPTPISGVLLSPPPQESGVLLSPPSVENQPDNRHVAVGGGVLLSPPSVENEGGAVSFCHHPGVLLSPVNPGGGVLLSPPPQGALDLKHDEGGRDTGDARAPAARGFDKTDKTDRIDPAWVNLINRSQSAKPRDFDKHLLSKARQFLHDWLRKLGPRGDVQPPDDRIVARVLAIAEWPQIEAAVNTACFYMAQTNNHIDGPGFFEAVAMQQIHGIEPEMRRHIKRGLKLVGKERPAPELPTQEELAFGLQRAASAKGMK